VSIVEAGKTYYWCSCGKSATQPFCRWCAQGQRVHAACLHAERSGRARRLRPISIARHVYDTGITAIPIVSLIAF
jgi:hypothetical protein